MLPGTISASLPSAGQYSHLIYSEEIAWRGNCAAA